MTVKLHPLKIERSLTDISALVFLKWRHAGQACVTANRVYVQSSIYTRFSEMLLTRTRRLVVGHGSDSSTTMGPVTTPQSLERLTDQVSDAEANGGIIACGGKRIKKLKGYFFEPTVILNANARMKITQEETFGPLCALYSFDTEGEVVKAANDTSVGSSLIPYTVLYNVTAY